MPNDKEFELDDLESFSFDDLSLDDAPPPADPVSGEDPFGVWVKSAPEDVGPESESLDVDSVPQDTLPEEDFLSSEELANLDDSFDFVTVSDEPLEGETPLEEEIAFLDTPEAVAAERAAAPSGGASFDEVSLDDFVSFDDVPGDDVPGFITEVPAGPEGGADDDMNEEFLDIDIDIEDDIGDEELEIIEGAAPRNTSDTEEISLDSFSAQDVDLSEFGDFEEVTPVAAGPLAQAEDLPEVMDIPDMPALTDELELVDEVELTDELELTEDPELPGDGDLAELTPPDDEGFFEETLLEDHLPSMVEDGPVTLDLEPDDHTDLDHIKALEDDLTSGIRPSEPAEPPSDLAAMILGKIEQELSSIKQEITELKREVTHLRTVPVPTETPVIVPEGPATETKPHGFFDEEDDETIALTGDELDNILSTAEISEGEEPGLSLDEDLLGTDEEGNLVLPEAPAESSEVLHVTDEEFLSGTALDLNDDLAGDAEEGDLDDLGIPESIELEEGFPLELEEGQTEDLLSSPEADDFEVAPLPEGLLEGSPEPLEIPFDDDIGLELDAVPLVPPLAVPTVPEIPELADLPPMDTGSDGWSPAPELNVPEEEEMMLSLEEEPEPVFETTPPPVPAAPAASMGALSPGLKEELKAVLQYMDKLLASLPDDKIQEFAESEHFEVYKRLFEELGLIE